MPFLYYFFAAWFALAGFLTIYAVGRPRKPISSLDAAVSSVVTVVVIALLIHAGQLV